jgi:excisionase family DNA binding protein
MSDHVPLLSRQQAADYLCISVSSIDRLLRKGAPHVRIGRRILFNPRSLEAWIEAGNQEPMPSAKGDAHVNR